MKGLKLPSIKSISFNYTTSLNRAPSSQIRDFFISCMPDSLKEFWLSLKAINKSEISACFVKVFPKVTEKLMITDAEITEKGKTYPQS